VLESGPGVLCLVSPGGTLDYVSGTAQTVLGREPDDHVGRSFLELIHPDDIAPAIEALANTARHLGPAPAIYLRVARKDGSYIVTEVVAGTYEEHDGQRRIAVTLRDLSSREPTT
jgi:PAS domain S-box-containing protein